MSLLIRTHLRGTEEQSPPGGPFAFMAYTRPGAAGPLCLTVSQPIIPRVLLSFVLSRREVARFPLAEWTQRHALFPGTPRSIRRRLSLRFKLRAVPADEAIDTILGYSGMIDRISIVPTVGSNVLQRRSKGITHFAFSELERER
jgi:hypothetical protein